MQLDDRHIKRIALGDNMAFKVLYDKLFYSLTIFAYHLINNYEEASDIVQDSLLIYWNRRKNFKKLIYVKAFLYTVIKNACLNYTRNKNIHEKHVEQFSDFEEERIMSLIIEEEVAVLIDRAIREMPDQSRKIIKMSIQGMKNSDIAATLGVSINTIKTLKFRAYRKLREKLKYLIQ